jgi:hypothetical protein
MRLTAKEIDLADEIADAFFEEMDGEELTIVGLTVLMISAGFILRIANNREEALMGMQSLMKDIQLSIDETFPEQVEKSVN